MVCLLEFVSGWSDNNKRACSFRYYILEPTTLRFLHAFYNEFTNQGCVGPGGKIWGQHLLRSLVGTFTQFYIIFDHLPDHQIEYYILHILLHAHVLVNGFWTIVKDSPSCRLAVDLSFSLKLIGNFKDKKIIKYCFLKRNIFIL